MGHLPAGAADLAAGEQQTRGRQRESGGAGHRGQPGHRVVGVGEPDPQAVRAAVDVPILRKDFVISEYQLLEARVVLANL